MDKDKIETILRKNKVKGDKIKKSLDIFKYQTQQFFDKTTIVPPAFVGEASRTKKK